MAPSAIIPPAPEPETPADRAQPVQPKAKRKRKAMTFLREEEIDRLFSVIDPTRDRAIFRLEYPSLLAVFAAMFAQDLVDHEKRLVTCPMCGALAASSSYRRTYCSSKCAWRARKRRQRAKAEETAKLFKRGKR